MRSSLFAVCILAAVLFFSTACTPDSPEPEPETPPQTTEPAPPPPAEPDTTPEPRSEIRETPPEPDSPREEAAPQRSTSSGSVANLMDASGSYTVQIAAHRNEHMARRSASQWNERGYSDTHVVRRSDDDGDTWYKVFLGRYASFSNAERASQMLNQEYSEGTWPLQFPQ
ncbi:MAG: SPOR domain-containing protein [Balneolia bacterium]|nr:SPOR domain-containing protein [Balneolia bacterium]